MRCAIFFLVFGAAACAQSRDVLLLGDATPLNTAPTFENGYLVAWDRDPRLDLFGPDGVLRYRASAAGPDGASAVINSASVDLDGTLAAAVRVHYGSQRCIHDSAIYGRGLSDGGGIALFDETGMQVSFIDTGCDYWPTQVAFAPDHSLWTIGSLAEFWDLITADYLFLRHYARDGTELGRYLSRGSFPHPDDIHKEPLTLPMIGLWELRVTSDRVTAILHRPHMWVQTDLDGKEIGRWNIGPDGRPRAITADGNVWRMRNKQLEVFDRVTSLWKSAPAILPDGNLIGAQGSELIFLLSNQNAIRRIAAPAISGL